MIPNRIVLDTNVCLDLFVFDDPRSSILMQALQGGTLQAVTRADCRTEWLLVLAYPQFSLDAARQADSSARFDRLITCLAPDAEAMPALAARKAVALPRCRDADDQKFLETARDAGAATLLTKDKALLKLAGRCRRAGLFDILLPGAWVAAQEHAGALE
jgi:putative PIN family toxin of toxin-antitoxin system